jgi:hypothetical protein
MQDMVGYEGRQEKKKGMRWLERTMGAELTVIQGEGHNLMTSAGVMVDVFESLVKEARSI